MVSILTNDIEMLQSIVGEHEHGCSSRYEALLELNVLESARAYYARQVAIYTPAEAPEVLPMLAPTGAVN